MNIFKQFYKSMYSPKDIATFIKQKKGKSFLFIFLIGFVTMLPGLVYTSSLFIQASKEASVVFEDQIPDFDIIDKKLVSNEKAPIIIKGESITYIFDSTGVLSADDFDNYYTIAFLSDGIYYKLNGVESIPYSLLEGIDTKEKYQVLINEVINSRLIMSVIGIIIFISTLVTSFALQLFFVLFVALLGKMLAKMKRKNYTFGEMFTIAPYTLTLITVFFCITDFLKINIMFGAYISVFIPMLFMLLSINELEEK